MISSGKRKPLSRMTQRTSIMITAQAKAGYLVVRTEAPDRRGRARGMSTVVKAQYVKASHRTAGAWIQMFGSASPDLWVEAFCRRCRSCAFALSICYPTAERRLCCFLHFSRAHAAARSPVYALLLPPCLSQRPHVLCQGLRCHEPFARRARTGSRRASNRGESAYFSSTVTYRSDNVALPDSVEPMPDLSILCECCIAVDQWLRF